MIRAAILRWAQARQPDFVIGGKEEPYLLRWWLIPRNRLFNIYIHKFLRSDDDRALHDHPWLFNCSILLDGMYWEHTLRGVRLLAAGDWKFRWGGAPHRVELLQPLANFGRPVVCWTLFVTGPVVREWGFHCPKGWVHWKKFTDSRDAGHVGAGCDQ
jgi:hypothetical protein